MDSERRMLSTLELPNATGDIAEEATTLTIQNEDSEIENIFDGITLDELTNDGQIEDASRSLVFQQRTYVQASLRASRLLRMGFHSGSLQVFPVQWTLPKMNIKQLIDN